MKNILWCSRHDMWEDQDLAIRRIYDGEDVKIVKRSEMIKSADDILRMAFEEKAEAICCVVPRQLVVEHEDHVEVTDVLGELVSKTSLPVYTTITVHRTGDGGEKSLQFVAWAKVRSAKTEYELCGF